VDLTDALLLGLVVAPVVVPLVVFPFASWFGLTPRGDPHGFTQRPYLALAFLVPMGAGALLELLLRPVLGEAALDVALVLGFFGGLVGLVVFLVGPKRLRPRWQRRQIELTRARKEQTEQGDAQGHPLGVELVVDDDEREPVGTAPDLASAEQQARTQLADRPDAAHALLVDLDRDAAIRLVAREATLASQQ
jgi:hypothetical protein